ncbi:MAG: YCF48-related protein [Ignavibacteriales bacterium]|nr:YCF48-related protein [Ignavibacteriales bacterium]
MKNVLTILILVVFSSAGTDTLHAQWVQQKSGTSARLSDVLMLDASTAIAVGRDGSILRTTNSGATWIDVAAPLSYIQPWSGLSFYDTTNGIVVGDQGVVLTTTNGGRGWIWHQVPAGRKCLSALHVGPGAVYVGTDSGWVYHTSDTARTWSGEQISTWPIRSVFKYRGPTLIGVSKYALTPYSLCTQYVVPPPSWGESILSGFQGLGSEAFDAEFCNGGGSGFIVGVQGDLRAAPTILRKSMTDTGWRFVPTGIMRDGSLLGVSAPSATVIYVCGSNGMIFKSSNGGDTWIDQTLQTRRNINAIFFFDETHGFAVGDSGLVLHTTNGGLTGVGDGGGSPPTNYMLEQNFPNPFNPSTNFVFRISIFGFVTLRIYDLLGKEVATLVSEVLPPGNYSRQWNAGGMPGGVYFYRLQAGSYTETKRLLFLK